MTLVWARTFYGGCAVSLLLLAALTVPPQGLAAGTAERTAPHRDPAPRLLWESNFDPPLRTLSDRNSDGDFLGVQWTDEGEPWKLLVIDGRGRVKREELLSATRSSLTSTTPTGSAPWKSGIEIATGGDYYAVVSRGEENRNRIAFKDRAGTTLQTIVPHDHYDLAHLLVAHDGSTLVVVENPADPAAAGQRLAFYDRQGLVRDYTYGPGSNTWLDADNLIFSRNGRYLAAIQGSGSQDSRVVLFDNRGRRVLEKRLFDARHYVHDVTDTGEILVSDYDFSGEALLVDRDGAVIGKKKPPIVADIFITPDARHLLSGRDIVDARTEEVTYRIEPGKLFREIEIDAAGYADVTAGSQPLVLIFGYSVCCQKYLSALVDLTNRRNLWQKNNAICAFMNNGTLINCGNVQVYTLE